MHSIRQRAFCRNRKKRSHCSLRSYIFVYMYNKSVILSHPKWLALMTVFPGASTIEKYDLRTNSWTQAGMMNGRRLQFGVAVIEENLYVIGGRDGLKTLNTVECYNLKSKNWTIVSPMSTHRHGLGKYKICGIHSHINICRTCPVVF